ncbi:MAG: hypothetical protein U0869_06790 [Chloroflexota bacterium]
MSGPIDPRWGPPGASQGAGAPGPRDPLEDLLERYVHATDVPPAPDLSRRVHARLSAEPARTPPRRFLAGLFALDLLRARDAFRQTAGAAVGRGRFPGMVRVQSFGLVVLTLALLGAGVAVGASALVRLADSIEDRQDPPLLVASPSPSPWASPSPSPWASPSPSPVPSPSPSPSAIPSPSPSPSAEPSESPEPTEATDDRTPEPDGPGAQGGDATPRPPRETQRPDRATPRPDRSTPRPERTPRPTRKPKPRETEKPEKTETPEPTETPEDGSGGGGKGGGQGPGGDGSTTLWLALDPGTPTLVVVLPA